MRREKLASRRAAEAGLVRNEVCPWPTDWVPGCGTESNASGLWFDGPLIRLDQREARG